MKQSNLMDTTEYEDACIALKLYAEEALRKDPDCNPWQSTKGQRLLAKHRAANTKLMAQKNPSEKAELMFPSAKPEPLFCKDCRWFKRELGGVGICLHSEAAITTTDLVYGTITTDHLYCSAMRTKGGVCGEEGRLWEAV